MGAQFSSPVPTDADFLVEHKPLSSHLLEAPKLVECTFRTPQKAWRPQLATTVEGGLGLTLKGSKTHCVISDAKGETRAMLRTDGYQAIKVCSFTPPEKGAAALETHEGEVDGRPLYEYAVVTRKRNDRSKLAVTLSANSGGSGVTTFETASCGGSCFSKKRVVHTVKRNGLLCATLRLNKDVWDCRIGPGGGIEPALLVALISCEDKFPQLDEAFLRQSSGIMSMKLDNVLRAGP